MEGRVILFFGADASAKLQGSICAQMLLCTAAGSSICARMLLCSTAGSCIGVLMLLSHAKEGLRIFA